MEKRSWSADMPESQYKGRVRVRVNGLLVQDEALLLVKMRSPVAERDVWLPPGGGLEFGETTEECLVREFREETGLHIKVGRLRHINELLDPPFHAVEFYFDVSRTGGELQLGSDPEHSRERQLLKQIQFIPFDEFGSYPVMPQYLKSTFVSEYKRGGGGISYSPGGSLRY